MAEDRGSSFLGGLLIGVFVGFVVGVLYAPRSGEETREILTEKAKEFGEETREIITEKAKEFGEKTKDFVEETKSKGRNLLTGKGVEIQEEETPKKS